MLTPLGKYLRKHRIDHGMTQAKMAKELGVSPAFLCDIEHGRSRIPSNQGYSWLITNLFGLNSEEVEKLYHLIEIHDIQHTHKDCELTLEEAEQIKAILGMARARLEQEPMYEMVERLQKKYGILD